MTWHFGHDHRFVGEEFKVYLNSCDETELKEKVKGCCCSIIYQDKGGKFYVWARRLKPHYLEDAYSK